MACDVSSKGNNQTVINWNPENDTNYVKKEKKNEIDRISKEGPMWRFIMLSRRTKNVPNCLYMKKK